MISQSISSKLLLIVLATTCLFGQFSIAASLSTKDIERFTAETGGNENDLPHPNLPLGDINVVVLTDTHSWVGGHGQKEDYDVDYGDVLSFYQLLQKQITTLQLNDPEKHKHDLFFVMNGDWIDGTGLALNGDPSYLTPLLQKMPWDAINVGNHELYERSVVEHITKPGGFVEWWGSKYLSSNIVLSNSGGETMGSNFLYLQGQHSTVLVFGFLYNMQDNNSIVTVKTVEETIKEEWFELALTSAEFDAILVLAHMDHQNSLIQVLLDRIRMFVDDDMPVQFVTGHTHYRGQSNPDEYSSSFEAGRFLDTVGFVSFPSQKTIQASKKYSEEQAEKAKEAEQAEKEKQKQKEKEDAAAVNNTDCSEKEEGSNSTDCSQEDNIVVPTDSPTQSPVATTDNAVEFKDTFEYVFIDAKYESLQVALGEEKLTTPDGIDLSLFIQRVRRELGLFRIVGCIKEDHYVENGLHESNSLWGLFCNNVVPHVFPPQLNAASAPKPKVVMMDKGSWRYDLLARELVLDEVIAVSPFNDTMVVFPGVPGSVVVELNRTLNANGPGSFMPKLPEYVACGAPGKGIPAWNDPGKGANVLYDIVTARFTSSTIEATLAAIWPENSTNVASEPPTSQPLPSDITDTTLSMWLKFFDETDLCTTRKKGSQNEPPPKNNNNHHNHKGKKNNKKNAADKILQDAFQEGPKLDHERITFVVVAGLMVIVLFGLYVRKRTRIFQDQVQAQELATLQALDEYNEQQELRHRQRYRDRDFLDSTSGDDYDHVELL